LGDFRTTQGTVGPRVPEQSFQALGHPTRRLLSARFGRSATNFAMRQRCTPSSFVVRASAEGRASFPMANHGEAHPPHFSSLLNVVPAARRERPADGFPRLGGGGGRDASHPKSIASFDVLEGLAICATPIQAKRFQGFFPASKEREGPATFRNCDGIPRSFPVPWA